MPGARATRHSLSCWTIAELATRRGIRNAGDVLTAIDRATPAERRELLERARASLGLASIESIETRQAVERATTTSKLRGRGSSHWQACAHCMNVPMGPSGETIPSPHRRYHCPDHLHLASADDLEPPGPWLVMSATGIVDLDEQERGAREVEAELERRR